MSFITGSHAYKAGIQIEEGIHDLAWDINHLIDYQFFDGKPVSLNQYAIPYRAKETLRADLGVFVQDTGSIRRITFDYALRFDYLNSYVPAQRVPAGSLPEGAAANNPMVMSVNSVNRTWADVNGNYAPDCGLTNFAANGECGAISDTIPAARAGVPRRWFVSGDEVIAGFPMVLA